MNENLVFPGCKTWSWNSWHGQQSERTSPWIVVQAQPWLWKPQSTKKLNISLDHLILFFALLCFLWTLRVWVFIYREKSLASCFCHCMRFLWTCEQWWLVNNDILLFLFCPWVSSMCFNVVNHRQFHQSGRS